ncbi:superoxide dismutase [Cu-Zn] [Elysia marginata]|uniref:Superoxide dismutase [Cu-Zn] n=1 Tax=Elysia marginata TaxID=1093978 RepID=A0AAV4IVB7_9GAST|nr:superoxide dismutase [Cu-Zn] [Elysia marginata]
MPRLSEVDRHRALGMLQAGLHISKVSLLNMNVKRTTIFRLRQPLHETDTLHQKEDDLGKGGNNASIANGNAGSRIGCCVIGIADLNT